MDKIIQLIKAAAEERKRFDYKPLPFLVRPQFQKQSALKLVGRNESQISEAPTKRGELKIVR